MSPTSSRRDTTSFLLCLALLGCNDSVGPACGRCLPVTAIGIAGEVWPTTGQRTPATVRLRLVDPTLGTGPDTVAGCVGSVFVDTALVVHPPGEFQILLYAGFPRFVGCLEVRVSPTTAGGFPTQVLSYPNLLLRDTSYHDTLHVRVSLP
jgi:hypothetical protein